MSESESEPSSQTTPDSTPQEAKGEAVGLRKLLKHSGIYSLAPLVQRAASILLIPILTYALREDRGRYGALELSDFLILLIPQFIGANLLGGLTRFYFEQKTDRDRRGLISSTFLILGTLAWLVCGLGYAWRYPLADIVYGNGGAAGSGAAQVDLLVLSLLIIPLSMTARMAVDYLVILQRPVATTTLRLGKSFGVIGLNIFFVLGLGLGAWGYLLGILIGEAAVTLGFLLYIVRRIGLSFRWGLFRPMLLFSLPLLPMGLLQMGLHQADRFLIKELIPAGLVPVELQSGETYTLVAVGIYSLGYKIGSMIHVAALGSFIQVWQPWLFSMQESPERRVMMVRVGTYALAALAAIYLPVAVAGRQIVEVLDGSGRFEVAARIAPWATFAYLFYGAYAISQTALLLAKRSMDLMWVSAAALVVNLAANFVLIPRLGLEGAVYATVVSFLVMAALGSLAAARVVGLCFDLRKGCELLLLGFLAVLAARWIDDMQASKQLSDALPAIGSKVLIILVVLAFIWRRSVDADGRAALADIVRKRLGKA